MRYVGQSYEIETMLPEAALHAGASARLAEAFHEAHARTFNHHDPQAAIEIINLRVRVTGQLPQRLERSPQVDRLPGAESIGSRSIGVDGARHSAAIFFRDALGGGQCIAGPAIVEQPDTTTLIPPGWTAVVDRFGNLVITQGARA